MAPVKKPVAWNLQASGILREKARSGHRPIDLWDSQNWEKGLSNIYIKTKTNTAEHLVLNKMQKEAVRLYSEIEKGTKKKVLVLKARQLGCSTLIQAMGYAYTRNLTFSRVVTISHETDATARLHSMQRFFLQRDDAHPVVRKNRIGALEFADRESSHYIGTAGSRTFGRGDTINFAHASEVAFWKDAKTLLTGLTEALTPTGSVWCESTPNGIGGYFYELWQGAPANGYIKLFFPWWYDSMYRLPLREPGELGILTQEEDRLVALHGLDLEQIKWRRDKFRTLRERALQEYPEDDISCFLSSGSPYFDATTLRAIEATDISEPLTVERGLSIWREPEAGHYYVVGADVAEGIEGGDFSVAEVIDVATGEQCAELRGQWPVDHFAKLTCELGAQYNGAMIAPERNNHGHAFLNHTLNVLKYEHVFQMEDYSPGSKPTKKYGWPTTVSTKPVMLSELDAGLMDGAIKVHSRNLLAELRTMHWNGRGGVEALDGCFDDCIIAFAIAWQARKQPQRYIRAIEYFSMSAPEKEEIPA